MLSVSTEKFKGIWNWGISIFQRTHLPNVESRMSTPSVKCCISLKAGSENTSKCHNQWWFSPHKSAINWCIPHVFFQSSWSHWRPPSQSLSKKSPVTEIRFFLFIVDNIFQNRSMVLCVLGILWGEKIDGSMCLGMAGKWPDLTNKNGGVGGNRIGIWIDLVNLKVHWQSNMAPIKNWRFNGKIKSPANHVWWTEGSMWDESAIDIHVWVQ